MSMETIRIYRDYPIVNNHVQYPTNPENRKLAVTAVDAAAAISGSEIRSLSLGSGRNRGSKCGQQQWLRLPGVVVGDQAIDYQSVLDAL